MCVPGSSTFFRYAGFLKHEPAVMNLATVTNLLIVAALMAVMLSMGLKVKFAEVVASARQVRLIVLGVLANFVLVPLVTVSLLYWFGANPMVSAGFLILAVCPGAPVGPPFTAIARGNVSCAIGLMVILAGLSAILAPALLTALLAQLSPDSDLHIDYLAIVRTLLLSQMLPLGIGLGIHHWSPRVTRWIDKPVGLLNVDGFYDHLLTFLRHASAERFLRAEHLASLLVEPDADILLDRMNRFRASPLGKWETHPPSPDER